MPAPAAAIAAETVGLSESEVQRLDRPLDSELQTETHAKPAGDPGKAVPLDHLQIGRCGDVCDVRAGEEETIRLISMGVCVGRTVRLMRPGDPLILKVLGTRIGLSARLARDVWVVPCATKDP